MLQTIRSLMKHGKHTQAIINDVHQRGATVEIGVQLFGSGNLQNAFDLVDDVNGNREAQISVDWNWCLKI